MNEERASQTPAPAADETPQRAGSPRRILVVDDDLAGLQISLDLLTLCGFEADGAGDGQAGWEALQSKHYDLLITDNIMPRLTGVELVKRLREKDTALPIIMVTGIIPTDELKRNPTVVINTFLVKPFTADQILGAVNELLPG